MRQRQKAITFSVLDEVKKLLPPSPHVHKAFTRAELGRIVRYVDDHQPFFYDGQTLEVKFKSLGVGVYRTWFGPVTRDT